MDHLSKAKNNNLWPLPPCEWECLPVAPTCNTAPMTMLNATPQIAVINITSAFTSDKQSVCKKQVGKLKYRNPSRRFDGWRERLGLW